MTWGPCRNRAEVPMFTKLNGIGLSEFGDLSGLIVPPGLAIGAFSAFDYRPDLGTRVAVKLPRNRHAK